VSVLPSWLVAIECGDIDGVRALARSTANLDCRCEGTEHSPLTLAAVGNVHMCQILIEAGARVDFLDESGSAALHRAAGTDRTDVVELLVAAGADPEQADRGGRVPLYYAAAGGSAAAARLLIERGADVSYANPFGLTALRASMASGKLAVIDVLLIAGAEPDIVPAGASSSYLTPFELALLKEEGDVVRRLVDHGGVNLWHTTKDGSNLDEIAGRPMLPLLRALRAEAEIERSIGTSNEAQAGVARGLIL
jgi:ankyrin repeat protein